MKSRQGIGNNNLMSSFLGLSSPFNDQSKDKRDYKHSKKNKHDNQIISFNACSVVAHPSWDIWSFGLVMVQLLLGRCMALPNFEKAEDAILKKLHKYDDDSLGVICNQLKTVAGEEVADLVHKLLQKDPKLRPKSFGEKIPSSILFSIA
jgi:serine/threonine protein kinase